MKLKIILISFLFIFLLPPGVNNTSPTDECWPGYYCVSGVDRPNPLYLNDSQCPTDTVHPRIGHACPTGAYCVQGSDYPEGCAPGYYQVGVKRKGFFSLSIQCFFPFKSQCMANTYIMLSGADLRNIQSLV